MKTRIPYNEAKEIADKIVRILEPNCSRIDIAGSIRRQKTIVGDVEICCIPHRKMITQDTLFSVGEQKEIVISRDFVKSVEFLGPIIKGAPDGRYCQIECDQFGVQLDLFMPEPWDYFRQLVIRTGSSEFVHRNIAAGWRRIGWCGSDKGLRKMADCKEYKQPDGKSKWVCFNENATIPPWWKDEKEFFDWIGVAFVEPKNRN